MSGGTVWTAPSMAVVDRWAPLGDKVRQRLLVEGIDAGLAWLAGHGIRARSTSTTRARRAPASMSS
ncbi:MAG: hypothetical protein U0869_04975 [Chloroflexota bacterium]